MNFTLEICSYKDIQCFKLLISQTLNFTLEICSYKDIQCFKLLISQTLYFTLEICSYKDIQCFKFLISQTLNFTLEICSPSYWKWHQTYQYYTLLLALSSKQIDPRNRQMVSSDVKLLKPMIDEMMFLENPTPTILKH